MIKKLECSICKNTINDKYGHNAQPINDGKCCNGCNRLVIMERFFDTLDKKK